MRAFSSCGERGPLFIAVRGPLTITASLVAEHRLQTRRLSSCGSRTQLLRGMWDLPRPGLEPVSSALAGRFSTTAPPGKPQIKRLLQFKESFFLIFNKITSLWVHCCVPLSFLPKRHCSIAWNFSLLHVYCLLSNFFIFHLHFYDYLRSFLLLIFIISSLIILFQFSTSLGLQSLFSSFCCFIIHFFK